MENETAEGRSVDAEQYPCSQCGAKLNFVPGTSALKCPYCGFESRIQKSDTGISELDYASYLEDAAQEKHSQQARTVQCDQCGAETTVPAETVAGICPFCGANMVYSGHVSRLIKPEGLLPFRVTHEEALTHFRRWIRSLWFAPGDLRKFARSEDKLAGVYIPFWTYDSSTATSYQGERGDHYYKNESYTATESGRSVMRTRRVRHTRWTPSSGTVRNHFDDILILASRSLPGKHVDQLAPWDLANLVPYADEYLSGFRAESYQVTLTEGFDAAKETMAAAIAASIRSDIGGDEQRIHASQTTYADITFKHILLPIWLSAYRFRDTIYRISINARTGEVQGDRPFSPWKIAGVVLAALVVIGILIAVKASQ